VVWVVSGGWFSAARANRPAFVSEFTDRGYTVFAVVHGSQPKLHHSRNLAGHAPRRPVSFFPRQEYGIDPSASASGGSAGGTCR